MHMFAVKYLNFGSPHINFRASCYSWLLP